MKKIAIVVGHCPKDPGASHPSVGSEYAYNNKVVAELEKMGLPIEVFRYKDFDKGYTTTIIKDMAPLTKDFDLVLELHFNSFTKETANGCEALYYYKNELGKRIATEFNVIMNREFGSTMRGAKALRDSSQRGFACVAYQKPTTLILEPFFCTGTEAKNFDEPHEIKQYAEALRDLIQWYVNV